MSEASENKNRKKKLMKEELRAYFNHIHHRIVLRHHTIIWKIEEILPKTKNKFYFIFLDTIKSWNLEKKWCGNM